MVWYFQWKHQTYLGAKQSPPVTRILLYCLPFNQILPALYLFMRILQTCPLFMKILHPPHLGSRFHQTCHLPNKILHSFIPLFLLPSLVYRGFVQTFPFLWAIQTHFQDSCLIWLHLLYFWEMMWELSYILLLIGILCDFFKIDINIPLGILLFFLGGIQVIFYPFTYCNLFILLFF